MASWIETPPGVKQPETTTWARIHKRSVREWEAKYEKHVAEEERRWREDGNYRRDIKNERLRENAAEVPRINRFRARINRRGGLVIYGKRRLLKKAKMPSIRYLSRSEINQVRSRVKKASTGRSGN
ncbi:hypothetical protein J2Z60_001793 [Lactobacillus colini]|uniref:Phage protein n=1 Tax=Lactobacillus colini TaxID=1819254 RepID=A0ABS4MFZ1_9LACO|nr:hypothetical protein [Lactobacillus colini]MBP2058605.1 hypothetical protein [Lactobacillus colini]